MTDTMDAAAVDADLAELDLLQVRASLQLRNLNFQRPLLRPVSSHYPFIVRRERISGGQLIVPLQEEADSVQDTHSSQLEQAASTAGEPKPPPSTNPANCATGEHKEAIEVPIVRFPPLQKPPKTFSWDAALQFQDLRSSVYPQVATIDGYPSQCKT